MADEKTTSTSTSQSDDSGTSKDGTDKPLSPADKHKNYLETRKRLEEQSVVDSLGKTPRVG